MFENMISILDFLNIYSLLGCVFVFLWLYSRSAYNYWRKLNVKYLEPVPFLGNTAPAYFRVNSFREQYDRIYKALYDDPFGGIYEILQPRLIVKSPELVSTILTRDFKYFHDRGMELLVSKNKKVDPLCKHLFLVEGERWGELRQKMSSVFTSGKLKQMHDQVLDCVDLLTNHIDEHSNEENSIDLGLKELFEKFTIDVIGCCAFGIQCNLLKSNDKLGAMFKKAAKPRLQLILRMIITSFSPPLADWLGLTLIDKQVNDFFLNLVLDTVDYRRRNGVTRNDFLQLLMELQNSHIDPKFTVGNSVKKIHTTEKFDEMDVAANAFLFFAGGFDATSATISYCIYELALNQDIQEKVRLEINRFKDEFPSQRVSYESLGKMTYMDAIISETLRKYPPVVGLTRRCTEDYTIPGTSTHILAGTDVMIPVWSIHHDWKNYPNPEIFDPERFVGDNKHSRPSGAYIPFGDGPHFCIGKRFAEIVIKSALAKMILEYDIKPCAKTEIPLKFKKGFGHETTCGIWVNLKKKKDEVG